MNIMKRFTGKFIDDGEIYWTTDYNKLKPIFGDKEKIGQMADRAIKRLQLGNPAFNCKKCGRIYKPARTQWVFHELCDKCFAKFDEQKVVGRAKWFNEKKKVFYYEDSDEWVSSFKD